MLSEHDWLQRFFTIPKQSWETLALLTNEASRPQTFYSFVPAEIFAAGQWSSLLHRIVQQLDAMNLLAISDGQAAAASHALLRSARPDFSSLDALSLAQVLAMLVRGDDLSDAELSNAFAHGGLGQDILIALHAVWLSGRTAAGT